MEKRNGCYSNFDSSFSRKNLSLGKTRFKKMSYFYSSLVLAVLIGAGLVFNSQANSSKNYDDSNQVEKNSANSLDGVKLALNDSSENSSTQSNVVTEKIYVKDENNVNFKYDESSIKIHDGRMECIEDDRILQWHEGLEKWECRKPTSSVFGKLDKNNVRVNDGGELECKENGKVLFWDGEDDQWSCGNASIDGFMEIGNNGLVLEENVLSIESPTCAGTDKLQWNGSAFVCSEDIDTDTDTDDQTLDFDTETQSLSISEGNSVDLSSLLNDQHNELLGLQGGTTDEYYHLTSTQHGDITNFFDSFNLPESDGTSGQVLQTDGAGNISWQDDVDTDTDDQTLSFDTETNELSISEGNSVDLSDLISGLEHNSLSGLQGGTTDEYYHLTSAQHSNLTGFVDVMTLPSVDGDSGQVLKTDGSGNLTWQDEGAGTSYFSRDDVNGYLYPATLTDDTGFGINTPTARVHIKGETSDDTTYALKVVNSSDTNLFSIRDDGYIEFGGDIFLTNGQYKDWNFPVTTLASEGGSNPGVENLASTTIKVASFGESTPVEEVSGVIEIDHDYKEGTDIRPHIHWYPKTANAGTVVWKMEYIIVRGGNIASTSTTIEIEANTDSTAWKLFNTQFPIITGTGLKIGDQIHFRLYRDTADADDDYDGNVNDHAMAATLGFHYQADSLGSSQILTK